MLAGYQGILTRCNCAQFGAEGRGVPCAVPHYFKALLIKFARRAAASAA
jgi:hypothetical protein